MNGDAAVAAPGAGGAPAAASTDIAPEVWARLRGLRLTTRLRPSAPGSGLHAGTVRGAGQEFAQYRPYEPGDDLRRIDWKLYARTDRHHIRDATRDAPLTVWLAIDTTASMGQADVVARAPALRSERKFDRAVTLATCVAELALRQGDSAGYVALGGDGPGLPTVGAAAGLRQRDRVRLGLATLRCAGRAPDDAALAPLWRRCAPDSLIVVLSDGYDEALVAWGCRLAAARRHVAFVQLLCADERDFPFLGGQQFRDQETGATLPVVAETARADFLARFADAQLALARRLAAAGVAHTVHVLDEPPDRPLHRMFGGSAGGG